MLFISSMAAVFIFTSIVEYTSPIIVYFISKYGVLSVLFFLSIPSLLAIAVGLYVEPTAIDQPSQRIQTTHPNKEFRAIRKEARSTLDNQIDAIRDVKNDCVKIIRLNLIIASVVSAGFSVLARSRSDTVVNLATSIYSKAGVVAWGLSIVVALVGYTIVTYSGGINTNTIDNLHDRRHTYTMFQILVVDEYYRSLSQNDKNIQTGIATVAMSMYFSIISILLFIVGIMNSSFV